MPSKYDGLIDDLKPVPVDDLSYQAKVDVEKSSIVDRKPVSLAEVYTSLRDQKKQIEAELYAANVKIAAVSQLLEHSQECEEDGWGAYGVSSNGLRLPSGETVYIRREPLGYVVDKDGFRQWCIENGYANQLNLWPTTMNALVKERLVAGEAPPTGTNAYAKTKVVFEKARVK